MTRYSRPLSWSLNETMDVPVSYFPPNRCSSGCFTCFCRSVSSAAAGGPHGPPIRALPSCPSSRPTEAFCCSGCQSSGSQAPLPNPGATRQGAGAVTVLPDAFREPGPPLPNSNLQAAWSRLRTPAATLVSFPPTTPQVSTAPRAAWSRQPFPSPCRVTVAGTDLRFCTKNWGHSQT